MSLVFGTPMARASSRSWTMLVKNELRARAAVELEVGVLLDASVAAVAVRGREVHHARARQDERDDLAARDLAGRDVVDEVAARADDERAVAVEVGALVGMPTPSTSIPNIG